MEHLELHHRNRLDVARHNRLYHVRLCQRRKCLLSARQRVPDRMHAHTQPDSSVGKRRIEIIKLIRRIRDAMQPQGISENRLLSTTGHVSQLTQRPTNNLLKCALVHLTTDLAGGDECAVYIPEDKGGLMRARCHEFYGLTLLSLSGNGTSGAGGLGNLPVAVRAAGSTRLTGATEATGPQHGRAAKIYGKYSLYLLHRLEIAEMTESMPESWGRWRRQITPTDYDERWRRLEATGANPHGEADFVFSYRPRRVLDAGCGTGRVAVELARHRLEVVGIDLDPDMIDLARAKAPELAWVQADLSELDLPERFDAVVLAGNVVPFVASDRRAAVVIACARHLAPGGRLIAGFQLQAGWPTVADYDTWCASAGLILEARYATWDRDPFTGTGSYAVSVHRWQPSDHNDVE